MLTLQDKIDRINEALKNVNRETKPLFEAGNEDEILLIIEIHKKVYHFLMEKGAETAKKRNLKRLKELGDTTIKPNPKFISDHKAKPSKASKPKQSQTKEEKLQESLKRLGLDPSAFGQAIKG